MHENVFQLDVAVNDFGPVILQLQTGVENLLHVFDGLLLVEGPVFLEHVVEVARVAVFEHHVAVLRILEVLVNLDDVRVVEEGQLFHHRDLLGEGALEHGVSEQLFLLRDLDRHIEPHVFFAYALGLEHMTELPTAEVLLDLEGAEGALDFLMGLDELLLLRLIVRHLQYIVPDPI